MDGKEEVKGVHPTHKTRMSDASTFDEVCEICGATDNPLSVRGDNVPYGDLAKPCSGPQTR